VSTRRSTAAYRFFPRRDGVPRLVAPFGIRLIRGGRGGLRDLRILRDLSEGEGRRGLANNLQSKEVGCIPSDVLQKKASEGEGACSPTEAERPHLPLRGKLGWMTPRAGWKQPESGCTRSLF